MADIEPKNHGLILTPPILTEGHPLRHHVFGEYMGGQVENPVIMPGGHGWGAFKPAPEVQANTNFDTENCTNYATNNAYETIAAFKGFIDFPKDCSERYTGIATGTTKFGNDPHHVAEVIRTDCGEIPELSLPFNDSVQSWDEYYSPRDLSGLKPFGRALLNQFIFGHAWVIYPAASLTVEQKRERIIQALATGPVCVSVYAWVEDANGIYYSPENAPHTHWVELLDFVEGEYWEIYDSYYDIDVYHSEDKKLRWDFDFAAAKVYYLDRNPNPAPTTGWAAFWASVWHNFQLNHLLGVWGG